MAIETDSPMPMPSLESIVRRDRDRLIGEVARLRATLAQIATVCADNAGPECNAHMALHFVHQIATTE